MMIYRQMAFCNAIYQIDINELGRYLSDRRYIE